MHRIDKIVDEKVDEELYLIDYNDELNEEEIIQQHHKTASTSPINTGSSPYLIYSVIQYCMLHFFLVQNFCLLESVFNGLYMQILMDLFVGNPDISRQMIANNSMLADNPKLREQMVNALSAMMEK